MEPQVIIGIIAGLVTITGGAYAIIRKLRQQIQSVSSRMERMEEALKAEEKLFVKNDCIAITDDNRTLLLHKDDEFIFEKIDDAGLALGKVYYYQVTVRLPLSSLKK